MALQSRRHADPDPVRWTGKEVPLQPTDLGNPDYFHKVVDCQWACPAHTPVPEYIRLIAAGRYADAYMVNWKSNVFPGILGRTCDRPCEPACRRGRVEQEPVAICRLKRVAADYKGDITDRLPPPPATRSGKRVACVGAGPASLSVARDLAAAGHDVTVFDAEAKAGGFIRFQIPRFRLPESVIDEEVGYILDHGVTARLGERVNSLKALLGEGYDAIFVGCGAPRGRDLPIPGRQEAAANIHIGIDWLNSVSFGHTKSIGRRVIVLGGGNTAMDCCRSARRLGGADVRVVVRSGFEEMKASPWEKEDAMHEDIPILNYLAPKEFVHEAGRLTGMTFEKVRAEYDAKGRRSLVPTGEPDVFMRGRRRAGGGRAGERVSLDRARRRHRLRAQRAAGARPGDAAIDASAGVLRRRLGVRAEEHHLGGGARARGGDLHRPAAARARICTTGRRRPSRWCRQKMGIHEWSYDNAVSIDLRYKVPHIEKGRALNDISAEVELGFDVDLAFKEAQRCLNCDVQTVFAPKLCIECDACVDICPVDCISFTEDGAEDGAAHAAQRAGAQPHAGALCRRRAEDRTHHGEGRGRVPALRPVRRTLPDRRVGHAALPARSGAGRRAPTGLCRVTPT